MTRLLPPNEPMEEIRIDHPLWRRAPYIALGAGALAGLAVAVFSDAVWWMPFFVFGLVAILLWRFLRPRVRRPTIEDEI